MKFNKEKIIDNVVFFIFTLVIYFITYLIKFDNFYKSVYIFNFLLNNGGIKYIMISYLIVVMFFIIIKSLIRDNFKAVIISTIIILLITIISYYKFKVLELPFLVGDILLIKNIGQISTYGLTFIPIKSVILIIFFVLCIVLYGLLRKKYYKKTKISLKNDWHRIPIFLLGVIMFYYLCIMPDRFSTFRIKDNLYNAYTWMGGPATFFMHIGDYIYKKPIEYTKDSIEKIKNGITKENNEKEKSNTIMPNIIFIMNESYSDPNKIKNMRFSKNPMYKIEELLKDDSNSKMGNIISPVFGGGTSLPEFEALSGLSSYYINNQVSPYTTYIRDNMNSIVREYNKNNYTTVGIHTNTGTFYNRKNVYNYLGFNKTVFLENMDKPRYKGDNVSDDEFAEQIIKQYREIKGQKFIFGVTMQNHMPYDEQLYNNYDVEIISSTLNASQKLQFTNYIQGVYDSNEMFLKLTDYLKKSEEPTILIMFGDHLPPLEFNDYTNLELHTTPYIIWSNYDLDLSKIQDNMGPSLLSINIMRLANINMSWYLKYFEELYSIYPAINNEFIIDHYYNLIDEETIMNNEYINNCRILQYDLLIKKKYIEIE